MSSSHKPLVDPRGAPALSSRITSPASFWYPRKHSMSTRAGSAACPGACSDPSHHTRRATVFASSFRPANLRPTNRPGRNTVDDRWPSQAPDRLLNAPAVWAGQGEEAVPLDVHKIESGAPQSPVRGVQANQRPTLDTAGPQRKMAIEDAPE